MGSTTPVGYGLCLASPPAFATWIAIRSAPPLMEPGPESPWSELSTNLGLLLAGSLLAQVLSYAPFLGVQLLAEPSQKTLVADFIVGLFLSRLPIVLFQAVQAALLPGLARQVSAGHNDEFRHGMRQLMFVVCGIGALGIAGGATIGPSLGHLLFGAKFDLDNLDLTLLATGSALFILALTISQGLIALSELGKVALCWVAGVVAFVVVTAFSTDDLFLRVELGSIAGAGTAAFLMFVFYEVRVRRGIGDLSLAALVEQIEHEPLEF